MSDETKHPLTQVRRHDRAVTDEGWIRSFLHRAPWGVLASAFDGQPFAHSNLFVYDETAHVIYFHTAHAGRTRTNVEHDGRVCFSVGEMGRLLPADTALEFSVEYASVMVFGHATVVADADEARRALLFDLHGQLVARSRVAIEPYFSERPGWAEQHPHYFWDSLCQACQGLWAQTGVSKQAIKGVGLTTQRATVVNVDRDGEPLRPAIVWLDQRRAEGLKPISGLWGLAFRLARTSETVAYLQAEAEANWIRIHQPEIWHKTHKYLYLSGYLTYRLTSRFVDSIGCQVGYMPFDYKRLKWAGHRD